MTSVTSTSTTGTSYTSSYSSGIDWDSLIEAAVSAKTAAADTIDTKISDNEAKLEAYEEMQTLLQDVVTAAQALRSPSGTSAKADDVFLDRAAYLTANGDVDESSVLSVTVEDGSDFGTYDVEILQIAKAHKVISASVASKTEDLGYDGVFSIGLDGGESAEITIDSDMSLSEIAEAINDVSSTSGITASVVKISDSKYELLLTAGDTGVDIITSSVSGDDVLAGIGLTDSSGKFTNVLQESQDAIVSLDGVEITRSSNDIDDVIDGVTFHLYAETPDDTSVTVEVDTDLSSVKEAIQSLVDAYNAYREFAYTQQQVTTSGSAADDALLFGDGTLRSANNQISDALNTMIDKLSIADIGLSFDSTNNLVLDEDVLDDALLEDVEAIQSLLSFDMTSSSSSLGLLARGASAPTSFTLEIEVDDDGNITSATADGVALEVSDTRLLGIDGTEFEGFSFVYVGTESKSIDVEISYGIAELLYNATEAIGDEEDGTLAEIISGMQDVNTTLEARADDIRDRAETYRDSLTARYASYEAKIAEAKAMLAYLDALLNSED
ncbi:flagellar filament capping protein FliD [Xanthobacteraceae bacterium Astr-EGSB]|uniref:flagellar filament capping protein FliD n=1 Tax=Astrobacterium formosum TaxID=3069710 RepID=UPI0027B56C7B|nr:flagellar filament capping protein FliD [Xanthobacteraceae bacterium Astr-EGSB]